MEDGEPQQIDQATREAVAVRAVLSLVARVAVVEGHDFDAAANDEATPVIVDDPVAIEEVRLALALDSRAPRMDWMTLGGPTIKFYASDHRFLGAVTLILPDYIRSPTLFDGDAKLAKPHLLAAWLSTQGIS